MNSFTPRPFLIVISFCAYAAILISMPFRTKKILKKAGNVVVQAKRKQLVLPVIVIVCCAALIFLLLIRDFGIMTNFVICLVAILGVSMGSAEASLNNCSGVYENGLIGGGHYLPFAEIAAIPSLSGRDAPSGTDSSNVLHVTTNKKGSVSFIYADEAECAAVLEAVLRLAPNLDTRD